MPQCAGMSLEPGRAHFMARGDETYHRVSAHEEETMATAIEVDSDRLEMLRSAFSGTLLQPDDDGYDEARPSTTDSSTGDRR